MIGGNVIIEPPDTTPPGSETSMPGSTTTPTLELVGTPTQQSGGQSTVRVDDDSTQN